MTRNFNSPFGNKLKQSLVLVFSILCFGASQSLKAQDGGISALVVPYDTICGSTNWPVIVTLNNYGASPIDFSLNNATVTVTISGASSQNFTFVVNTGILNGYSNQNVTVTNIADMSAPGYHVFNATVSVTGDANSTNDAMPAFNVFVKPTPVVNGEPNPSVCAGIVMPSFAYTSTPAGATFTWTNDQPSIGLASGGSGTRPSFTPVNPGASTIIANITVQPQLNGCIGSTLGYMIQVQPSPTVNAGPDQSVCAGSTLTFSASSSGTAYSWAFGDGGTSTLLQPSYSYTAPGIYTATLTATSAAGCTANDFTAITVFNLPVLTTSFTNASCFGVCNGSVAGSVTGGATPYTYLWVPGGVTTPTMTNICAGTYTLTATDNNGWSAVQTATVLQPTALTATPASTNSTCYGACNGTASVTASGGTPPYTYLWSPGGYSTPNISSLCAGTYTVNITDANGCNTSANITITQPAAFTATATSTQTICEGDVAALTGTATGGVTPYTFGWTDGSTNFSGATLLAGPIISTSYTLTAIDNVGCTSTANSSVIVLPATDIYGHVIYSGGSLSTGTNTAVAYHYVPFMSSFDTLQTSIVDAYGNFHFTSMLSNSIIIKIFNDTSVYPLLIPTYYGNQYLWDSATVIIHNCSAIDTADITMQEVPLLVGPGHVDGTISEGSGFIRVPGDPIPGVDIKLGRNPGGQLMASTISGSGSSAGQYSFDNIPANVPGENYTIYVDIPGLGRISTYNFVIDAGHTQFVALDYKADSNSIYTTQMSVGLNTIATTENKFKVYPNPAKDKALVVYSLSADATVSLGIYNILGVKEAELVNSRQFSGDYKLALNTANYGLKAGVYFITLSVNGKLSTQRLVITE